MNYLTEGEELVEYLKSPAMNLAGVVAWLRSHDARVLREEGKSAICLGCASKMQLEHYDGYALTPGLWHFNANGVPVYMCAAEKLERRASEIEAGEKP